MTFEYRKATRPELVRLWDQTIAAHPADGRWARWKQEYVGYHESGQALAYLVLADGEPVGEGTLLLSPACGAVKGQARLCDGLRTANVNALRILKAYEGQGHISRLMRIMEDDAKKRGLLSLTIGVEAAQTRNLAIYLHWGYNEFLFSREEDGALILYYQKIL